MKYVAIDIETGGLNPDFHSVLEIGAAYDDLELPEPPMVPKLQILVQNDDLKINQACLSMHKHLLRELRESLLPNSVICRDDVLSIIESRPMVDDPIECVLRPEDTHAQFMAWLSGVSRQEWGPNSIFAAGKNVQGFDIPFLERINIGFTSCFHYRAIDVGSLFIEPDDKEIPSLCGCLKKAGLRPTSLHSALGDAIDVVKLVRFAMRRRDRD